MMMISSASSRDRQSSFDKLQLVAVVALAALSAAFVFSATSHSELASALPWYRLTYFKQIIWFVVGTGAAVAVCIIDYHSFSRWAMVAYIISMLTLIVVLIPGIGSQHHGAGRWIDFGGFQLQPSEFAKLAFILAEAHFLSRPQDELRQPGIFWRSLGLMVLPFILIMKEPDLGSGLVLLPTGLVMLYAAGAPRRYLVQLLTVGGVACLLIVADVLFAPPRYQVVKMHDYQKSRLMVYFGLDYAESYEGRNASPAEKQRLREKQFDASLNVRQSLIAVGSGGLTGKGWRQGQQNGLGFLPTASKHNDFIFSVIAEELGFVGSGIVILLYAVVLFTGIRIAGQARDRLGKLLAVGVVALLFSHVFINIGMNIRIMPVTGVPLPLLSYGGSSVLCSLIAIGMLQNVYIYRKAY